MADLRLQCCICHYSFAVNRWGLFSELVRQISSTKSVNTVVRMSAVLPAISKNNNSNNSFPQNQVKSVSVEVICLPFIRSGQNHPPRHSERGKKTRQTEEEAGRQHQGMDRPGVRQVTEGSGEKGKMEETGCEIICGAPTTLAVKGEMRLEREIGSKALDIFLWELEHQQQVVSFWLKKNAKDRLQSEATGIVIISTLLARAKTSGL